MPIGRAIVPISRTTRITKLCASVRRYNQSVTDTVRAPAVAGTFYPASPIELGSVIDRLLAAVLVAPSAPCPKALIVPHAGYIYSGPIAASAFARVAPYGERITRVVLVGPAHRVFVEG